MIHFFTFWNKRKSIDETDENKYTCLHSASLIGSLTIIQYVIKNGADIENQNTQDKNPLFIASENGHIPVVEYLIKKGYRYDVQNRQSHSLFVYACENKKRKFVEYILSKEKSSFSIDELCRDHPLHYACENGHLPVVQYLIEKGANIEAKDWKEKHLHLASIFERTDVLKYLVSKGANKISKNKDDKTPFDLAYNDEIRKLLKRRKTFHLEELTKKTNDTKKETRRSL